MCANDSYVAHDSGPLTRKLVMIQKYLRHGGSCIFPVSQFAVCLDVLLYIFAASVFYKRPCAVIWEAGIQTSVSIRIN